MKSNKILNNAKWIILCKIIQSCLQLVIGMMSARYLGPSNYGLINYAKSVVSFVVPVMQLGLNATLVHELIEHPDDAGEIMGTALTMSLVSGVFCVFFVANFVLVANKGEHATFVVCVLYSLSMLFQALELMQYWFHSKLNSKYPSIAMLVAYCIVSTYKIYLLICAKSVYWFAMVYSVEYGIIGIILIVLYTNISAQKLKFSIRQAQKLFSNSKYYILSSLMVTVFQNTDHIILKIMAGDTENGYYSAAITCASVCQFVYMAIIDSLRPVILDNKKKKKPDYKKNISILYGSIIYMSIIQGSVFAIFAKPIMLLLYGGKYIKAVPVLRIIVWQLAFSYMGTIRNIWILAEKKHSSLWKINFVGVCSNIILDAILIPKWGAVGASFASVVTQCFINFVFGFFYIPIKENNKILIDGLNPKLIISFLLDIYTRELKSRFMRNQDESITR